MAELVEHQTLDFGSGRDLTVVGLSPVSSSMLSMESVHPSPSAPSHIISLSLLNKLINK